MTAPYDRSLEDCGNVIALEHVNLRVPDQRLATLFYVSGLGLTRDPYLVTGVTNMWINCGRTQFHLPTGDPQRLRGRVELVMPDRDGLLRRLEGVREPLAATAFAFEAADGHVDATCPWGNRLRCHEPAERFGRTALGIARVVLDVPPGAAGGIARFYREVLGAPSREAVLDGAPAAEVRAGCGQALAFRETPAPAGAYDGHHVQIYVADFSGPHRRLEERGLVSEESGRHQYRFERIVDPGDGRELFRLEHEVRSLTHPLFGRPLVNRNPDQTNQAFGPGHEALSWALEAPGRPAAALARGRRLD